MDHSSAHRLSIGTERDMEFCTVKVTEMKLFADDVMTFLTSLLASASNKTLTSGNVRPEMGRFKMARRDSRPWSLKSRSILARSLIHLAAHRERLFSTACGCRFLLSWAFKCCSHAVFLMGKEKKKKMKSAWRPKRNNNTIAGKHILSNLNSHASRSGLTFAGNYRKWRRAPAEY